MTAQASRLARLSHRDLLTLVMVFATVLVVVLVAVTRGGADVGPTEADGWAISSVVMAPESSTTLTTRCPEGHAAEGGVLEVKPSDARLAATAQTAVPGSFQWAVQVVSGDPRSVTVTAAARCEPLGAATS